MDKILSPIKKRILKYIDYKGISVEKFCLAAGIAYSNMKGKALQSEIGGDSLAKILTAFPDVSPEWLIIEKGDMIRGASSLSVAEPAIEYLPEKTPTTIYLTPQIITVDESGDENIVYVPIKAAAGYLNGYSDREYIERLPSFTLPELPKNATYRAFQVSGDSMYPTLENGEMVIGQWLEKLDYIRDDRVHIIVTKHDGVLVKRLLNRVEKYGYVIAKSDALNDRQLYPNIEIPPEDILEVWYAVWHGGFSFKSPGDLWNKQNNLEADVTDILRRLKAAGI